MTLKFHNLSEENIFTIDPSFNFFHSDILIGSYDPVSNLITDALNEKLGEISRTKVLNSTGLIIGFIDKFVGEFRDSRDKTFASISRTGEVRDIGRVLKGTIDGDELFERINVIAAYFFFFGTEIFEIELVPVEDKGSFVLSRSVFEPREVFRNVLKSVKGDVVGEEVGMEDDVDNNVERVDEIVQNDDISKERDDIQEKEPIVENISVDEKSDDVNEDDTVIEIEEVEPETYSILLPPTKTTLPGGRRKSIRLAPTTVTAKRKFTRKKKEEKQEKKHRTSSYSIIPLIETSDEEEIADDLTFIGESSNDEPESVSQLNYHTESGTEPAHGTIDTDNASKTLDSTTPEVVPEADEIVETTPEVSDENAPEAVETIPDVAEPVPDLVETVPEVETTPDVVPEVETIPEVEIVPAVIETVLDVEIIPDITEDNIPEIEPEVVTQPNVIIAENTTTTQPETEDTTSQTDVTPKVLDPVQTEEDFVQTQPEQVTIAPEHVTKPEKDFDPTDIDLDEFLKLVEKPIRSENSTEPVMRPQPDIDLDTLDLDEFLKAVEIPVKPAIKSNPVISSTQTIDDEIDQVLEQGTFPTEIDIETIDAISEHVFETEGSEIVPEVVEKSDTPVVAEEISDTTPFEVFDTPIVVGEVSEPEVTVSDTTPAVKEVFEVSDTVIAATSEPEDTKPEKYPDQSGTIISAESADFDVTETFVVVDAIPEPVNKIESETSPEAVVEEDIDVPETPIVEEIYESEVTVSDTTPAVKEVIEVSDTAIAATSEPEDTKPEDIDPSEVDLDDFLKSPFMERKPSVTTRPVENENENDAYDHLMENPFGSVRESRIFDNPFKGIMDDSDTPNPENTQRVEDAKNQGKSSDSVEPVDEPGEPEESVDVEKPLFTEEQETYLVFKVRESLLFQIQILIRAMAALKLPFTTRESMECAQKILMLKGNRQWSDEYEEVLKVLWTDRGFQHTFSLRGIKYKLDNEEIANYLLDNIFRLSEATYKPDLTDMKLLCPDLLELFPNTEDELPEEIQYTIIALRDTVIGTMKVLIRAAASLQQPIGSRKAMECAQKIFMTQENEYEWDTEVIETILTVWEDEGMQITFGKRNIEYLLENPEPIEYVCANIDRLLDIDFYPTDRDVDSVAKWSREEEVVESKYTIEEKMELLEVIQETIFTSIKHIIVMSAKAKKPFGSHEALTYARHLLSLPAQNEWNEELKQLLEVIFLDRGIQEFYTEMGSSNYFLNNFERMNSIDYIPTDEDCEKIELLHAKKAVPIKEEPKEDNPTDFSVLLLISIPALSISKLIKAEFDETPIDVMEKVRKKPGVNLDNSTYVCWRVNESNNSVLMDNNEPIKNYGFKDKAPIKLLRVGEDPEDFSLQTFYTSTPMNTDKKQLKRSGKKLEKQNSKRGKKEKKEKKPKDDKKKK